MTKVVSGINIILVIAVLLSITGCTMVNSIYITNYTIDTIEVSLHLTNITSGFQSSSLKSDKAIFKPGFNSYKRFDNRISAIGDSTKVTLMIPPKSTVYLGKQYEIPDNIEYFTYTIGDSTQRFEFNNFTFRQVGLFKIVSNYKITIRIGPRPTKD